jgi:hypothetical protein
MRSEVSTATGIKEMGQGDQRRLDDNEESFSYPLPLCPHQVREHHPNDLCLSVVH